MTLASLVGLLLPALDAGSGTAVLCGLAAGVAFLLVSRWRLRGRSPHIGGLSGAGVRRSILVFAVLFAHSLPEGFAVGTAFASTTAGLSLFVILAIGVQNIPEGTSVAIPMQEAGFRAGQQFWAAVATSAPQPIGALVAYLLVETVSDLLPVSFAFAAGAMLALVVAELLPQAFTRTTWRSAGAGLVAGTAVMLALSRLLAI